MFKCLSLGTIGVKTKGLEDSLQKAKAGGFEGLDVSIKQIKQLVDERGADEVKVLFSESDMRMGNWGLPVDWRAELSVYQAGLEELRGLAEAGASVGAFRVSQWVPPASPDMPFMENLHWHVDRFRPICEILKDHECRLGLEFIGPRTMRVDEKYAFIHSLDGMLLFGEVVGTGNVGLLLDAWHWYTGLGTLSEIRSLVPEDVVHVHVNDAPAGVDISDQIDNVRALPSETGVIDLPGFLRELHAIGYDGPVTPEPFSQRVKELPAVEAILETGEGLDRAWKAAGLD